MNDQEIQQLVTNVVQAIKAKENNNDGDNVGKKLTDAMKLKNMNLLEALNNLKNSSIYQVAAAAASAASTSQSASFNKASFHNYLQSTIPLANVRGATDPRFNPNACVDLQNFSVSYDTRLDTNMYQTIENSLYMNMCIQNESIIKAISEPLPPVPSTPIVNKDSTKMSGEFDLANGEMNGDGPEPMNVDKTGNSPLPTIYKITKLYINILFLLTLKDQCHRFL